MVTNNRMRLFQWPGIVGALFLGAFLARPAPATTLIEQAREAGVLSVKTALLYQVYQVRDPRALPPEYREDRPPSLCGTPALVAAHSARESLSPAYRQSLAKALARPSLSEVHVTPSGRFRIHYDRTGQRGVDPADSDANGVPDYVDVVAAVADSVWRVEIDFLGYDPPPSDQGLGGGNEYDLYIVDLGRLRNYGFTTPEGTGRAIHSYIELDNDYADLIYTQTRGLDALRVTMAHEFFHAIQFGYYPGGDGIWWQEASSTWMEEVAYPEMDDYLQYVAAFLRHPERALDSDTGASTDYHKYGASLFAHFLDQRFARGLIRSIWEELRARSSAQMEHFDRAIRRETDANLAAAMSEFAVWNYFTGTRHQEGRFYREGYKYREGSPRSIHPLAKTTVQDNGHLVHLSTAYIQLEPQLRTGGVVLEITLGPGQQWDRQLLLVSRDGLEIRPVDRNPVLLAGWDRFDEVVLVLTVTEPAGSGYGYQVIAEYDPQFVDEPAPLTFRLEQNFPNPFRPEVHGHTVFPFDLSEPSRNTRLSIYTAAGQLVQRFELGGKAARFHTHRWDGSNAAGALAGSGIYYYVLEADDIRAKRTMALIRK